MAGNVTHNLYERHMKSLFLNERYHTPGQSPGPGVAAGDSLPRQAAGYETLLSLHSLGNEQVHSSRFVWESAFLITGGAFKITSGVG